VSMCHLVLETLRDVIEAAPEVWQDSDTLRRDHVRDVRRLLHNVRVEMEVALTGLHMALRAEHVVVRCYTAAFVFATFMHAGDTLVQLEELIPRLPDLPVADDK